MSRLNELIEKKMSFKNIPISSKNLSTVKDVDWNNEPNNSKEINLDIQFYITLLKSCPKKEELPHYLPKKENSNFKLIMNLLISSILKEIIEIETFIKEEAMSEEEKLDFLQEINEKRNFIAWLIEYRDKKEISEIEQIPAEKENTLIYLQSSSGNYYALAEAEKMEVDYYDSFLELLNSIKKGTFKNIKMITSDKIQGLLEVKNFKTRIIFQRVDKDVYCILSMFMKKVDNDYAYREHISTRNEKYKYLIKKIKQLVQDEAYIEEQQLVTERIEKILKKEAMSNGRH